MQLVYVCSPLAGDIEGNIAKAIRYCTFASQQGVLPLAPHTIFTQYLNDNIPAQREQGLQMGIELLRRCDELWVCGRHHFNWDAQRSHFCPESWDYRQIHPGNRN